MLRPMAAISLHSLSTPSPPTIAAKRRRALLRVRAAHSWIRSEEPFASSPPPEAQDFWRRRRIKTPVGTAPRIISRPGDSSGVVSSLYPLAFASMKSFPHHIA